MHLATYLETFFVRNITPQFTEGFYTTLDSAIEKVMGQCFNSKNEESYTFIMVRTPFPIHLGGLGINEVSQVRCAEFIGESWMEFHLNYLRQWRTS